MSPSAADPETVGAATGTVSLGGAADLGPEGEAGTLAHLDRFEGDPALDDDEIFDAFNTWVDSRSLQLYPAQEDALLALFADQHVVLTTPTGSGKSMVAVGAHARALGRGERSFYTAPIKSLVSEKFFDMRAVFGTDAVGMLTGDASINPDAPIICCTAEILGYHALSGGDDAGISLVTMDEFHFYAEKDRGWAWQVPLLEMPSTQFLLMSATLGDTRWLRDDLAGRSGRDVAVIGGGGRPVPLEFAYRTTTLTDTIADLVEADRAPIYVVHFTQRAAAEQAQAFTSLDLLSKDEKDRVKELIAHFRFDTPFGSDLKRFLGHGVGVHHAGLLPRYRLLVERLARDGLLKLICGTDTLGVGVNVPIRTVLLTQLCKYDGSKTRVLTVREFQQIAGRAGRRGFDTSGTVWAQAPLHVIENLKAEAKAVADPSKRKKIVKKKPPERGYAHWDETTFDKLVNGVPETLSSHLSLTHTMVMHLLARPGDGETNIVEFIERCHENDEAKQALRERAASLVASLESSGIIERLDAPDSLGRSLQVNADLQDDFALHHPLSPFLIEVVASMDMAEPGYALDVLSVVEATLDDPMAVLLAQQDKARDAAYQQMRADGVEFDARQEILGNIRWPRPLEDELRAMFATFGEHHPWVAGEWVRPKAVARQVYEEGSNFRSYVRSMGIKRSEGLLVRYLTDCYRAIDQNVPEGAKNDELEDIASWLAAVVRSVDSSLLDEWDRLESVAAGGGPGEVDLYQHFDVLSDPRAFAAMVRSEMFRWVQLLSRKAWMELGHLEWTDGVARSAVEWRDMFEPYWDEFGSIAIDASARGPQFFDFDPRDPNGAVRQILVGEDPDAEPDLDPEGPGGTALAANATSGTHIAAGIGTGSWIIEATVDRERSREEGVAIVRVKNIIPT